MVALRRPDDPIGCEGPDGALLLPVTLTDVGTSCRLQCFMGRALNSGPSKSCWYIFDGTPLVFGRCNPGTILFAVATLKA